MLKNYTLLIFCIINFNGILAQTPELVVNVPSPGKIGVHGDYLFIAQEGKVSKIALNVPNPNLIDFIINTQPLDFGLSNDYMYLSESNSGSFNDKILKVNITNPSSTATDIIINSSLNGIAINGNDLYITDFGIPDVIFKVDVTTITSPTLIETTPIFINSLIFETYNMYIHNNILYLAQTDPDLNFIRVSKIDLTASSSTTPTPIFTGFNSIPRSFVIKDNYMYIALADKISKIDINESNPTLSDVTTEVNDPQGLAIKDCILYISEKNNNRITKLDLCSLSIVDNNSIKSIFIYPIPSKNQIKVSGLTELKNYKIFNSLGVEVNEGIVSNNENINIQNLTTGFYFLKLQNGDSLKFIKE